MRFEVIDDNGKGYTVNGVISFETFTRAKVGYFLEKNDIYPSTKNINIFIEKGMPKKMLHFLPTDEELTDAILKARDELNCFIAPKARYDVSNVTSPHYEPDITSFLQDGDKILYYKMRHDMFPHQLIYNEDVDKVDEIMQCPETRDRILCHTFETIKDVNDEMNDEQLSEITGITNDAFGVNEEDAVHIEFCYSLPSDIIWYSFEKPKVDEVYAIKRKNEPLSTPFREVMFNNYPLTGSKYEGLFIFEKNHILVAGNERNLSLWNFHFHEFADRLRRNDILKETVFNHIDKLFQCTASRDEALWKKTAEHWIPTKENVQYDGFKLNSMENNCLAFSCMYGTPYAVFTGYNKNKTESYIIYYPTNRYSVEELENLTKEFFNEGIAWEVIYHEPTEKDICVDHIYKGGSSYDVVFTYRETEEERKKEIGKSFGISEDKVHLYDRASLEM